MEIMSYSNLRANLASAIDKVNEDNAPIFITRSNGRQAVLMSLDDYTSMQETIYLFSNPTNAEVLNKSIEAAEQGLLKRHELKK